MNENPSNNSGDLVAIPVTLRSGNGFSLTLPTLIPKQSYRPAQSNIPDDKRVRNLLAKAAAERVRGTGVVPPLTLQELREHSEAVVRTTGLDARYVDYTAILLSNAAWRDTVARIPYERRLLLLPKCLRVEDKCPAPFDEFGLLCKECGLCSIQDLTVEAERLGYAVLVAEGSAIVRQMIETGKIDAVVGVSCINVLEKCFPHLEAAAVPGLAIPLLQDDCVNTTVDLDWVWDVIHLTSDDKTYRLDLDALKQEVQTWFRPEALAGILGAPADETSRIARDWLSKAGKRWRPYLATCAYMALQSDRHDEPPQPTPDLRKLAVAIECFHKASLIHDDIEDGDDERYGERALHAEIGMPAALNVGDSLLGEGYRLIGELAVEPRVKVDLLRTAAAGHLTLSRGQGLELIWARRPAPLTSVQVLDIFRQKTAPAFEVALRLGASLGGADEATHEVLRKYSESIGIAYQIRDDLEDYAGTGDSGDLEDLRPSLLLAIAHKRAEEGAERDLIASLFRREARYSQVADEVRRILRERAVLSKADDLLEAYKEDAIRSLRFLSNATLKGLLRRVVGKIFGERLIEGYCSEFQARNAAARAPGAASGIVSG
ncbi:MAG: polyprenyl synthetase family protein [Planctomycetes bacterium]|nr:polyprenyl synthetase family protein [Planctomycetota bacterium]